MRLQKANVERIVVDEVKADYMIKNGWTLIEESQEEPKKRKSKKEQGED